MDPAVLTFIGILVPSVCTIIVAILNIRAERSKKIKELEDEKTKREQEIREKKINETLSNLESKINTMSDHLHSIENQVETLQETDDDTAASLGRISLQHQVNSEYIHEVSKLITVLAEGMRDQHLDGNITNAIAEYHKFESDVVMRLSTSNQAN